MIKKELMEAMKYLADNAEVKIFCTSANDTDGGHIAHDVYVDDIIRGDKDEITIVAHY